MSVGVFGIYNRAQVTQRVTAVAMVMSIINAIMCRLLQLIFKFAQSIWPDQLAVVRYGRSQKLGNGRLSWQGGKQTMTPSFDYVLICAEVQSSPWLSFDIFAE